MNILVIGGTRYFGIHMVRQMLEDGHAVTIATRGIRKDDFGKRVSRLVLDLTDAYSIRRALRGRRFDVVADNMGYSSCEVDDILSSVSCGRFIHMSTAGVYRLDHFGILEEEFDPGRIQLVWCGRKDMPYDDVKRQAEAVLSQKYAGMDWSAVRCPVVLGKNDYTNRLLFYVSHIVCRKPMHIDNLDCRLAFSKADEVGKFLAFLADKKDVGPVNACSAGTVSVREIIRYVEEKSKMNAVLESAGGGDEAPYNGMRDFSLCIKKAQSLGFEFSDIHAWIWDLLDDLTAYVKRKIE